VPGLLDLIHPLAQWDEISLDFGEVNRLAEQQNGVIKVIANHVCLAQKSSGKPIVTTASPLSPGPLLKAELDYTAEVKDDDGNVKGSGEGRLEITITQVNEVTVEVPR
jgi:hypothetical protein